MLKKSIWYAGFILLWSCSPAEERKLTEHDLTGNWLVVSSEPQYGDAYERQVYLIAKDSIVSLKGLKLISIREKGLFQQMDSLYAFPGSWLFNSRTNQVYFNNGGPGFASFTGTVLDIEKDTLRIKEKLDLEKPLSVIWHFKRITNDSAANYLFIAASNAWREKPSHAEDEASMKKRLSAMFHYYSVYFDLVSREATYFSPKRVLLPVTYYRHGVGMRAFEVVDNFKTLFFNEVDCRKAYDLVERAIKAEPHFPSGKDYVDEYAIYFNQLKNTIPRL